MSAAADADNLRGSCAGERLIPDRYASEKGEGEIPELSPRSERPPSGGFSLVQIQFAPASPA